MVQTPRAAESKKGHGGFEFEAPALWTKFLERFHGGEGMSPRRVVIVVTMVCFLGLALAAPLRTFFEMRSEAASVAAEHAMLTSELQVLEARKAQLDDPDYVRAQARERLGFVTRGETPYIVELPGNQFAPQEEAAAVHDSDHPWYKNLWDSVSQPLPDENAPPPPVPNVIPGPSSTP
ncbi:FtsB family cell division protein [Tomitella biformata]|uniref:FtsB family cell division protein n=1 Tax=Tomitella biformata TaxID=630403 RepID=UPI0004AE5A25|nr:septum formation initiator family protein [Tomitella biformata]